MTRSLLFVLAPSLALVAACAGDKADDTDDTNGVVDTGPAMVDADGDGYPEDEDCNDNDGTIFPGAAEICDNVDNNCDGQVDEEVTSTYYRDADGDGFGDPNTFEDSCETPEGYVPNGNDCDDQNDEAYPGNAEVCDYADNDCDGEIDEEVSVTYYADSDVDGFGDPDNWVESCSLPAGYVIDATDCDDTTAQAFPGNLEICDELDNDCDGEVDEEVTNTYYADTDGDGWGDASVSEQACSLPTGYAKTAGDCDDAAVAVNPDADEECDLIDNDCDGSTDEDDAIDVSTWYQDTDSDSYGNASVTDIDCYQPTGYVSDNTDCDDTDGTTYPSATELCDGQDNDCDSSVPSDELDDDSDAYVECTIDSGGWDGTTAVTGGDDCDDTDSTIYPTATELCDGQDNDCDSSVPSDEQDNDGDTFVECTIDGGGWDGSTSVTGGEDCDDADIVVYPGAPEICDGQYNDCDDPSWSATTAPSNELDDDGDGFVECTYDSATWVGSSAVTDGDDCDDTDADTYPGADEYCDGHDDDCDGVTDEDDSVDVQTWYADDDSDGYGDAADSDIDCYQPTGYVSDNTDCDDGEATTYPGADEYCDGHDDDCDGTTDEDDSVDVSTWYADTDSDGYGDAASSDIDCYQPTGYVSDDTDCDDGEATTYPGADEYCDGEDDDCDGTIDEDDSVDSSTWYADTDSDGYGDASVSDIDCYEPTGYVADSTDCDDTESTTYPGADEYCDGVDNDCDGTIDEDDAVDSSTWYADTDSDTYGDASSSDIDCYQPSGYVADSSDCDDTDEDQYPGADEYCNSEDDDCDGDIDEDGEVLDGYTYYADDDADDLGDEDDTIEACSAPSGYVDNYYDCDDNDASEPVVVDASAGSASGSGTLDDPFDSVQDGIDDANLCVIVYGGTYKEAIDLDGKSIELWGVEGADFTTIDADGTPCDASDPTGCESAVSAVSGTGAAAELIGFTITGGTGTITSSSASTTCADSSASHAGDNTCTVNTYEYWGGGVLVDGDDLTLTDCVVEDNTLPEFEQLQVGDFEQNWIYSYGGGVAVLDGSLVLDGAEIYENYADQGGGIYAVDSSTVDATHTKVMENTATDGAGGLLSGGADLVFTNAIFACNDADTDGGGLFVEDSGTGVNLTNVVLAKDESSAGSTHGSGIWVDGSGTLVLLNSIVWSDMGAYAVYGTGSVTATYSNVYNSDTSAYTYGGTFTAGTGGISSDPDLDSVTCDGNPLNDSFTLDSTSPSIDAGNPATAYDDIDGTQNDQGAYGGPDGSW